MAKKHLWTTALVGLALGACAPKTEHLSEDTRQITSELGCDDAETRFFDRLIDGDLADPARNPRSVRLELIENLSKEMGEQSAITALDRTLRFLLEEVPERFAKKDATARKRLYAALEFGSSNETDENELAQDYQSNYQAAWKGLAKAGVACAASPRVSMAAKALTPTGFQDSTLPLQVRGMRWAFATAYQSCEVLTQKALVSTDPDVKGIVEKGHHPDGVGIKRFIDDLPAVLQTHPYLHTPPASSCLDIRGNPLIYDYGGRPYIDTASVDLHRNAGSGTTVLGIDCSAYVGTSLATAGLKTKSGVALRPEQAGLFSSHDFLNPEANKLDCMTRIPLSPTDTMKNGDIVAVSGHVFMVDKLGGDPFGVAGLTKVEDCSKATSDKFDFEIFQSSNSKNGVGLNRYVARDYLKDKTTIKAGLEKYAVQACKNRLNKVTSTPKYSDLSVTRHKGTKACIDPRVPIAREACVNACFGGQ